MKTKIFLNIIVAFIVYLSPLCLYATDSISNQSEIKIRCIKDNYSVKLRWSTTNSEHWEITNKKGFRLERYTFKRNGTYLDSPEKTIIADSIKALPLPLWKDSVLSNNYAAIIRQRFLHIAEGVNANLFRWTISQFEGLCISAGNDPTDEEAEKLPKLIRQA